MLARFEHALKRMEALDATYPGEPAFASIIAQLSHIIQCLREGASPVVADKPFTFGFFGVRFVREFDTAISRELSELKAWIDAEYGG